MSKMPRDTLFLFIYTFYVIIENSVNCESTNQPRIVAKEGDLVFQAAQDKNITIRLAGSSRFMINDVNVMDALQKVSVQRSPVDDAELVTLPTQVKNLKMDFRRLTNRLRRIENRTSSLPNVRIRRLQLRVRSLLRRVGEIETKLREDDCISNPCRNGGTCFDLYENFHCECPDTWTGKTCNQDVDECYSLTGTDLGCQNNAACVNMPGSYRCVCTNGFAGTHCRDRGTDCSKSRPGELCGNGACIPANNDRGYDCICDMGWKMDNATKSCTLDVNECLEALVPCHTSCINLPGSFMCGPCPTGYTGNGVSCRDIDECLTNNGGCSTMPKVQCINTEGSHRCGNCPPGWTGDGRYCNQAETNTCADNSICHPLASCEYISNTMVCRCPLGMSGSGYGPSGCRAGSSDPCSVNQCLNGGICINRGNKFSCICPTGFDPPLCGSQNPCSLQPCLNGGSCSKQDNSNEFQCTCPRGFTGARCQIKRNTCGSVIRDRVGDLTHPSEGGQYSPNEACAWVIRTDDNLVLNVTFSRFNVQLDPECSKDWLQINDGRSLATPLIGRFCGNQLPNDGNILSSQNTLFLWFRTDNTTNLEGFSLSWNSVTPICGGRMDVDAQGHGVIKSPGYPGKSPPKRDCEWVISAPYGKRLLLRFYEVVMDRSANCTKDSLIIYDTNEVMEHVCETGVPPPKHTSSNVAKIHFHTDPYREDSLFQMHYEVVEGKPGCGGLFTEPEGKILFSLDMANCVYLIQQPVGTRILLAFINLDTPRMLLPLATLTIYDGKTEDDPVLARDSEEPISRNLTSSRNFMLININVRDTFIHSYRPVIYEMTYKVICGADLRGPQGGTFMTPHYPQAYYPGLHCVYSIVGPLHSVVHLNITDYNVSEYDEGCTDDADFIEVYYAISGSAERHCKGAPLHMVAPSNYLRIDFSSNTNPQKRRGFSAEYHFERMGCGGVLRDMKGSFELLDPVSLSNVYCEWILEAPEGHEISLDLLYQRTGTKCPTGEADLRIFINESGIVSRDVLVDSHCGGEKHITTTLPAKLATIFLKLITPSLASAVSYSVQANYTFTPKSSNCGGNYTLQSGSIQSPNWPNEYYDSMDCIWVIHAPLGHKIALVPRNFSLEDSNNCNDDYLEIRNGMSEQSPLIGKYCSSEIPPHIPSFTNHLYLRFHSDSTFTYPGFDITFQQTTTGCGGSLSSHRGSIASPHYPEISRGPVQCDWKITVSQGSAIDVRISRSSQLADFCSNGVLTIYDGDDSLSKKIPIDCSPSANEITLKSSRNVLYVRYALTEIGAAENQQFYLDYSTNCVQTLDALEGVIESPNFPEEYPNYLRCEWNIQSRKEDTISLTFSHFELEKYDSKCSYDVFEVIDMKNDESLQTRKICRNPMEVITSDGNRMVVKFSTDFSNSRSGFRLEYKRNGCGGYLTRSSGIIASPKFPYSVDVDCEWLIEVTPGKQIVFDIFEMQIESEKDDCSTNGLIVKNDKTSPIDILKECKVQQNMPMTVTAHGSTMFIRFYSDATRSRKYFKASFRIRDAQCGGIFRGNQGIITSPNYPQNYTENSYCEWLISVESSSTIEYFFETLDFPASEANCSHGFVEIYDGIKSTENIKPIDRYCSANNIAPVRTQSNRLNVIFSSGNGPPAKGFVLKYRRACGGLLTAASGFLKSNVQDGICLWIIKPDQEGVKISINFLHIECHCDGLTDIECSSTRGVTVSVTVFGPNLFNFCEHHPPDFISDNRFATIGAQNVTFIAKYTTVEVACGGSLSSLRGSFASPYYPQTYPSNIECVWTIEAAAGNYLEMNFNEMDIASSDNCNQDYLEVRERTSSGKILGIYCSNAKPDDGLKVFEKIWIKFHSSEDGVGKGFKASWTYAQVNEISGFNGEIQPPPVTSMRSEKEPFQWRITVPRDNLIFLTFAEYNRGLLLYDGFDTDALPIDIQLSPWEVTSSTNVIYLASDNQMLDHFRINWKTMSKDMITTNEAIHDCNETLNIAYGPVVNLTSPGYPTGYEGNLQCQWLIKSDHPTRHAVVELYDVRLEKLDNCYADYLQIFTSKNLNDWHEELKICDSPANGRTPIAEIHGTPYLKMNLITDTTVNKTGFQALLYTACGGNLTGSIGRILDVDVLNTSERRTIQNCTWHIDVRMGRKIQFNFEFPLFRNRNNGDDCENFAIIRDGHDENAPILPPGRICSIEQFNGTVLTTGSRATVKYFMQKPNPFLPIESKIWNLTYHEYSDCGGEVRLTSYFRSVNISSPNYPNVPNPRTECIWTIVAPPGEAIQAEFVDRFDMNIRNCAKEFVELRDGSTELARQLGKYCLRPGTIRSSGNVLYLRYLTDIDEPRNGFKVNLSLSTCGGTFTQFSNVITSANYPALGGYPSNSICDYVIKVTTFQRINLTFLDLHLPFDVDNLNSSDQIRIYQIIHGDGRRVEDEVAVIYGNATTLPTMQVDSNEVLIRFYSFKANNKYRGFKVKYDRIYGVCYKDVSGESGVLSLSIAPRRLAMYMLCRWKITVPKGRRVKVEVLDADKGIPNSVQANKNFKATFFNDFLMMSRITTLDLNNITINSSISSTDNKMFIRIFGAYSTSIRRMRIAYSSSEVSQCPDDITTDTGSLSLVALESTSAFFCNSDFLLNAAQTISFNISRLAVDILDQRLQSFAIRFKTEPFKESARILNGNLTNANVVLGFKHGSVDMIQNEYIRMRAFEATFTKHPCGGDYRIGNNFDITLPNLTTAYGRLDCAWHMTTVMNKNGYEVIPFAINFVLPCENEYAAVYAGLSSESLEVARYCRGAPMNISHLSSRFMLVVYHTTAYSPNSAMIVSFKQGTNCGGRLQVRNTEHVQFTPRDYVNNLECLWDLETSAGFFLQLAFVGRFYIEDSKDCVKDYLEVRVFEQGSWKTMPRYCGRSLPPSINTTSHHVQLVFRSDSSVTADGFSLNVQKTCYGIFNLTDQPQMIVYPSRWSMANIRMQCNYIFQSDSDKYIQLKFKKLILGQRDRCVLARLTGQKRTRTGEMIDFGPYCKDNAVSELRGYQYISLLYEAVIETGGYEIEFSLDRCGGQVTQPKWIESLKNEEGDGYANNMNCVWNITAPDGYNVVIQFKYLIMEKLSACTMDYVAVYSGSEIDEAHREAKMCGNLTTNAPNFHFDSKSAIVVAQSDSSVTKEGFMARILFSKACDERLTLSEENSPVELSRDLTIGQNETMSCTYRLMGAPGFRIEIELKEINLNFGNAICAGECADCDYLEILDSLKGGGIVLGKYCSSTEIKPKVISSYKDAVIRTKVEREGHHKIVLSLRLVKSDCDSQSEYILEDDNAVQISSSTKSNGMYPSNVHCTWKFTSKTDFDIRFTNFNLQNKSDATGRCLDYVYANYTISYASLQEEHCGTIPSYVIHVDKFGLEAAADITFHSDEAIESTGFTLTIANRATCDQTYNHTSGVMGGLFKDNIACLNDIYMPENYTVNILIPMFFFRSTNCSENYIRVYDKKTNLQIYENCIERYTMRKIFTTTNQVRIDVKTKRPVNANIHYYGSLKSLSPGCGGNLETPDGYLSSPKYQEYANASVCRWNLTTTSPNRIEVNFDEFNMGSVCRTDYVKIIEIAANGDEKESRQFCEQNVPDRFISEHNRIAIVSLTSKEFDGTGWSLSYRTNAEGYSGYNRANSFSDMIMRRFNQA